MVHLDSNESNYNHNNGIFKLLEEIRKLTTINIRQLMAVKPGCVKDEIQKTLEKLLRHLDAIVPSVKRIKSIATKYDFKPSLQANGYHSLVTIFRKCCLKILEIVRSITLYKESWLFNEWECHATLDELATTLGQLRACFYYMERLNSFCSGDNLFPDENNLTEDEYASSVALMYEFETLNPECFYGRCLAFQYAPSMIRPLTVINQALACHSRVFPRDSRIAKIASGIASANVYFRNVEERARRIATVTRECDVDFCQSFWSISDNPTLIQLTLLTCPGVAVDHVMNISFEEFEIPSTESDGMVTIKTLHPEHYKNPRFEGPINRHVSVRLLSAKLRSGQESFCSVLGSWYRSWKGQKEGKSPFLIIHLHGGGYVGQSSASHKVYLRSWAVHSDVPILSVDYSHAPQFRAPYQLEEAFFAYCWALKNSHLLGSTAEKVVVVGDSAGGNIAVGVGLMAAHRGVRRPDGVYPIYGPMMIQYKPGPSRLLAIMDPLIPLGILSICLQAYLGTVEGSQTKIKFENTSEEEDDDDDTRRNDRRRPPTTPPSFPLSLLPSSPFFTTAIMSGLAKSSKNLIPQIFNPSALLFHRRNDSGFFDVSSEDKKSSDEKMTQADVKLVIVNNDEVSTSAEDGDLSEYSSDLLSSPDCERSKGFRLSDVVASYAQLKTFKVSPMARSLKNNPGDSPFISPVLAPDNLLKTLNRVHITACHLDPLLDDSIILARRLREAGVPVDINMVSDLPHGFLNFVTLSPEAYQASVQCIDNIVCLLRGLPTK